MDTVAHCLLNLAALERGEERRAQVLVLAGAIVPDVPMFFFYLVDILMTHKNSLTYKHNYIVTIITAIRDNFLQLS